MSVIKNMKIISVILALALPGLVMASKTSFIYIENPYLIEPQKDVLFHLRLSNNPNQTNNVKALFRDTQFIILVETSKIARNFAAMLKKELNQNATHGSRVIRDLAAKGNHYFNLFKVGPVIIVNHNKGYTEMTLLLHELIKLIDYAGAVDPAFIKVGTSCGVDVPKGSIVIGTEIVNEYMLTHLEVTILGKPVDREAQLDQDIPYDLKGVAKEEKIQVLSGTVASMQHFYEGLAMKSGAYCDTDEEEREAYKKQLEKNGVIAIDTEGIALPAFTYLFGLRSALVSVVVNDCFAENSDSPPESKLKNWQTKQLNLVAKYIKDSI